jgi:hypothetical protein
LAISFDEKAGAQSPLPADAFVPPLTVIRKIEAFAFYLLDNSIVTRK